MEEIHISTEAVELSNAEKGLISAAQSHQNGDPYDNDGDDDIWCDDGSLSNDFNEGLLIGSDLDREWHRRHNQFHTIGYRDGLTSGKEASAQEGFNDGFKQSVLVGYKWGLVRGVTSVLAGLPDDLKEKLVGTLETREKFQNMHESVHSISTKDALNFFNDEIVSTELKEESNMPYEIPSCSQLGMYIKELKSHLESSTIRLHSAVEL